MEVVKGLILPLLAFNDKVLKTLYAKGTLRLIV